MTTDQLRQRFLDFFASKGHKIYPSDSLVCANDPTLLFTSAGMNQFKQEFLSKPAKFRRRASCQKCLRTADLDKVGKTSSHHTFFEMLGNFSFGDYFKDEAIAWAWEFVTKELKLPKEKLWVSVYQDDAEAYKIWKDKIGIAKERVVKLGPKQNFWPANAPEDGPNGPCGPCSEIFYDQGKNAGCGKSGCGPGCDCGRFVEVWNLVFTQFERKGRNNLVPLPDKNIDTGMGLERTAAVLQGKPNNFEIDIFEDIVKAVIKQIEALARHSPRIDMSLIYAIADHVRAITFAIADGVWPSNDKRGYVIRKLIRRAAGHSRALGVEKSYFYKIVPEVTKAMRRHYPELEKKKEDIAQVVRAEEKRFCKTLERSKKIAEETMTEINKQFDKGRLSGKDAFRLYETYGLSLELLEDIAVIRGVELDKEGFERELELQRKRSRDSSAIPESVFVSNLASKFKLRDTKFVGEKKYSAETKIAALFKNDRAVDEAKENDQVKIVLESTPFYGESGGQIGDRGVIKGKNAIIEVFDTHKVDQVHFHLAKVTRGTIKVGERVKAEIDRQRRNAIICNHSATHLLQAMLRKVLGEHVRQSGSWVSAEKLRFDFTHFQPLSQRQLARVEQLVNEAIRQDRKTRILAMDLKKAQGSGALAFFGEKYQEKVRVVKIGDISLELCGGMHVTSTGKIKKFKITGESSVASGIRRIEAVTASKAEELLKEQQSQLKGLAGVFAGSEDGLAEHVDELLRKIKEIDKRLDKSRMETFKAGMARTLAQALELSGVKVIVQEIKSVQMHLLRIMADLLRQKVKKSVVVLASASAEGKVFMVCALSPEVRSRGLDAVKIIRAVAAEVGGSGGGRVDFAQAGGNNPQGIKRALMKVKDAVKKELKDNESN